MKLDMKRTSQKTIKHLLEHTGGGWIIPKYINDCKVIYAQLVNTDRGEFAIAFREAIGTFGTAFYISGDDHWFWGNYGFQTDIDAQCDAMDRARSIRGGK